MTNRRLLFVDDETNILSGLKRMLRPFSNEWEVDVATSGEEALKKLEASKFDCIITDMRMPGMSGAALLSKVHDRFPGVARFVLSGHADSGPIMQAVPVTHQFMSKPIAADKLVEAMRRACALHDLVGDEKLRTLLGKIASLPARPEVFSELTNILSDENASTDDIARVVEKDIAISTKLLQVVNSAFFGLAQNMSKVKDAVAYLGVAMIKSLVLSQEMFKVFDNKVTIPGYSIDADYRISTHTARIAKTLLKGRQTSDDAFMAGILYRSGRLIMAQHMPEQLKALIGFEDEGKLTIQTEQEVAGAPVAHIAAYLLGLWGLPYPVVEAVAHYQAPWKVPHEGMQVLDAIYIASVFAECKVTDYESATIKDFVFNEDYLKQLAVYSKLPEWLVTAKELRGQGQ